MFQRGNTFDSGEPVDDDPVGATEDHDDKASNRAGRFPDRLASVDMPAAKKRRLTPSTTGPDTEHEWRCIETGISSIVTIGEPMVTGTVGENQVVGMRAKDVSADATFTGIAVSQESGMLQDNGRGSEVSAFEFPGDGQRQGHTAADAAIQVADSPLRSKPSAFKKRTSNGKESVASERNDETGAGAEPVLKPVRMSPQKSKETSKVRATKAKRPTEASPFDSPTPALPKLSVPIQAKLSSVKKFLALGRPIELNRNRHDLRQAHMPELHFLAALKALAAALELRNPDSVTLADGEGMIVHRFSHPVRQFNCMSWVTLDFDRTCAIEREGQEKLKGRGLEGEHLVEIECEMQAWSRAGAKLDATSMAGFRPEARFDGLLPIDDQLWSEAGDLCEEIEREKIERRRGEVDHTGRKDSGSTAKEDVANSLLDQLEARNSLDKAALSREKAT